MSQIKRPHFGTDGIRGNADADLNDDFIFALGKSIYASILDIQNGLEEFTILIGTDTRTSGTRIKNALSAGLQHSGVKIIDVGILPTPAISLNAKIENAYACAITASHNPSEDNGIKVFAKGGAKTDDKFETLIENYLDKYISLDEEPDITELKMSDGIKNAYTNYLSWLKDFFDPQNLKGLKVALDCANGASFDTGPKTFSNLGAQVEAINIENDGTNINKNCGATNLESLQNHVNKVDIDIAFAFDGDADRIIVLDQNGKMYDGDYILALLAKELKSEPKTVVATTMSNGALKRYLEDTKVNFLQTDVGDKNVAIGMLDSNAKIGGEQSGHIIHKDYADFGDGVLIALLISNIFIKNRIIFPNLKASEMLDLFTPMVQLHDKVKVANKTLASSSTKIREAIDSQLSILGSNARIVIRPSGTENVVRVMVEADDEDSAKNSIAILIDVVKENCKE